MGLGPNGAELGADLEELGQPKRPCIENAGSADPGLECAHPGPQARDPAQASDSTDNFSGLAPAELAVQDDQPAGADAPAEAPAEAVAVVTAAQLRSRAEAMLVDSIDVPQLSGLGALAEAPTNALLQVAKEAIGELFGFHEAELQIGRAHV